MRDDERVTGAAFPQGPPVGPRRAPTASSSIVVLARIFMFCLLALDLLWGLFVVGVGLLAIMWGPPCSTGRDCADPFWPSLGIALTGAGVALLIGVIGLVVAWRRTSLWIWTAVGFVIAVGSALFTATTINL